jgi:hypothetical protein
VYFVQGDAGRSAAPVGTAGSPTDLAGYELQEVGREAFVTYVPAPIAVMPPSWAPKEMSFSIYLLSP